MIAFFHYGSPSDVGGVTTWLQGFLAHLRVRGEPLALRLHHFGDHPDDGTLVAPARALGVAVSARTLPSLTGEGVRDVLDFLNASRPSVFLPQCLPAAHFAARLAGERGLPWVFTLHSDDPTYWALADQSGPPAGQGVWVAVSASIAEIVRTRYPWAEVRVIPCGVEVPETAARWHPEKFRVVYSGRLVEEQKRISKVIRCLITLCRDEARAEAVILGDGPARAAMTALVEKAGLSHRIRFTGRLDPGAVGGELLQAQAILLQSDYEGLPVALLEGMAHGLVPVARAIRSGIPEIIRHGETGLLTGDDEADSARILARLANNCEAWERMARSARALVTENYSAPICHARWDSLLRDLSARCRVRYPLPVPPRPKLPSLDPRLAWIDHRPVTLAARFVRRIARAFS